MRRSFFPFLALLVCLPLAASAQTVDDIVALNLKAKGGDKWRSVKSVRMTGRVTVQGMEGQLTIYAKRPNFSRNEIRIQDQEMVQAYDGTTPWMSNGVNVMEITGPQGDMMKADADFDGALIDYAKKGHKLEFVGKEQLDGKDVLHLKLTKKNGNVQHLFLDAATGIEVKTATEVEMMGQKQTLETQMGEFKTVEGVLVPHSIKQVLNGQPVAVMTIEKVEFDPAIDDAIFRMPKKQ
jgi:outer membrane lipoprotein-sorting protein